jgi:hypothetical protein
VVRRIKSGNYKNNTEDKFMQYTPPTVFGKNPNDTVPQQWNFLGQQGWWRVPLAWFCRQNANGTITASPNSDFSAPTYDVLVNIDGYMVFQDLGRSTQAGLMSPAQR